MIKLKNSITIDKPCDEVFIFFHDKEKAHLWTDGLISVEQITPGELAEGTKFLQKYKPNAKYIKEVSTYSPYNRSVFVYDNKQLRMTTENVFEPYGRTTILTINTEVKLKSILMMLTRFMFVPSIMRRIDDNLEKLKELIDGK
jgi:hypothetical protein